MIFNVRICFVPNYLITLICPSALTGSANLPTIYAGRGNPKPHVSLADLITICGRVAVITRFNSCENRAGRPNQAADEKEYLALYNRVFANFDAYMSQTVTWAAQAHPELTNRPIAYFSMEYGLHETLPIYSGGLGVLAGDHLKEASDLGLPLVGVGLMYGQGFFTQRISEDGWQDAINNELDFADLPAIQVFADDGTRITVDVEFPDRNVSLGLWEIHVGPVPLYLLDSNIDPNSEFDKNLTARLLLVRP